LKWEYPRTIPARFGLIWFSGFRGKDLNVSSLTYILGFSVRFFQPVYFVLEYYVLKITSKSFAEKFELK
jgi:hypothetical protein